MATTRDPFTGEITFKNPNQVINTVTGQKSSGLQTLNTAPNVSTTMDASRLGEATPVKTIAAPIPTDTATPFVSGVSSSMDSLNEFIQSFQQPTQGDQTQTALTKRLSESLSSLEGKGARTQQLEMQAGVPENIKQLQEINLQIAQRSGEFDKLAISKEGQGRGIVLPIISGQQAVIRRQQAIEIGALASVSQAMQGNIALAQQTAQRTVDLEFQDREQEIDNLKTQLELNRDTLTREDRKRTHQLDIVLNERSRLLQEEKNDKTFVSNLMLKVAEQGGSASLLKSIRESTPDSAIEVASGFLGNEFKLKQQQIAFENGIRSREILVKEAAVKTERRKELLALAAKGDVESIKELGYDPNKLPLTDAQKITYETQKINIEKDIADLKLAIDNKKGLKASTGLVRGGLSTFAAGVIPGFGTAAAGSIAGPIGTGVGFLGGFTAGSAITAQSKNSFMGTARYVVANLQLNKVGELADAGIKLNPISEKEIILMSRASKRLASIGDYDEYGTLLGFKDTDKVVESELRTVLLHYEKVLAEINRATLLDVSDLDDIKNTQ